MEWSSAKDCVGRASQQLVDINENQPGQRGKARDEAQRGKSDYCEKTELETDQSGQLCTLYSEKSNAQSSSFPSKYISTI